jgi:hypothetical protein
LDSRDEQATIGMELFMRTTVVIAIAVAVLSGSMVAQSTFRKVCIYAGPAPTGGSLPGSSNVNQVFIDVEGWRMVVGRCPSR